MSLNKAMLIGNVGKDPEIRYIDANASGNNGAAQGNGGGQAWSGATKVASFTLATTERFRDRSGNLRENTEWHNIVAWRGNADMVEKYVRKGTQLFVEGRIRSRSWEDQSGNRRYITEIIADNLTRLLPQTDRNRHPRQMQRHRPWRQPARPPRRFPRVRTTMTCRSECGRFRSNIPS